MTNKLITMTSVVAVSLLSLASAVTADADEYQTSGTVGFIPSTEVVPPHNPDEPEDEVTPVDPTRPDGKPEPGMPGPLSIDFASIFNFGTHTITNKNVSYDAEAQEIQTKGEDTHVPDYVQVSDYRGNRAGWTLQLSQNGQFKTNDAQHPSVLDGAVISLDDSYAVGLTNAVAPDTYNTSLSPDGSKTVIMEAEKGEGTGTWMMPWGYDGDLKPDKENGNMLIDPKVRLSIPGTTPRDAATCTTTLTWTLINVPLQQK